jgi:hypothetical protein
LMFIENGLFLFCAMTVHFILSLSSMNAISSI